MLHSQQVVCRDQQIFPVPREARRGRECLSQEMRPVTSSCPQSLLWIAHCWPTLASLGPVHGGLWQGGVFLQVPTSHPKALAHREWSVGLCLLLTSHHHSNLHSFSPCPTGLPLPPQCVFIWFHLFWEDRKHHGCQVAFACWTS